MNFFTRAGIALKALQQLGPEPVGLNGLYRLGLATGHYKRVTSRNAATQPGELKTVMPLPGRDELKSCLGEEGIASLLAAADEIAGGKVRLFEAAPVDLVLTFPGKLENWTAYETGKAPIPWGAVPNSRY